MNDPFSHTFTRSPQPPRPMTVKTAFVVAELTFVLASFALAPPRTTAICTPASATEVAEKARRLFEEQRRGGVEVDSSDDEEDARPAGRFRL